MPDGRTLIQRIYDDHFEGADEAEKILEMWKNLGSEGKISGDIYERVLERLEFQCDHAKEWRDVINNYFYRMTEIPDEKGRKIYG